jgi:hypothetical protein
MSYLPLLIAVEPLAKLANQFALGPSQAVVIWADDKDVLLAPTVALDVLGCASAKGKDVPQGKGPSIGLHAAEPRPRPAVVEEAKL